MYLFRDSLARMGTALILALNLSLMLPAGAAWAEDALALRRAIAATGARDWDGAAAAARQSGPLASDIAAWHRLRAGQGSFAEYADFVQRNADWPGMELLRQRAEALMGSGVAHGDVIAWFEADRPRSGAGLRRLITALLREQGREAAQAALITHWTAAETPLEPSDEAALIADWGDALGKHHIARAQRLLDRGDWKAAQRLLPRMPAADREITQLRIDLQSGGSKLAERLGALPDAARNDPGVNLDRFRWRMREKDVDGARAIMLARSASAKTLGDPVPWAGLRADLARASLRDGDADTALKLAAAHFLPDGHIARIDLDWLAGYAAFKLRDWDEANRHFEVLGRDSTSAITQSRALYWRARTAQARGDAKTGRRLMEEAATHQSTWYGQLAAETTGIAMDPDLVPAGHGIDTAPDWRGSDLMRDRRIQAAIWLFIAGDPDLAQRFLLHTAETATAEDIGRMARLMAELHQPHFSLRLAKAAAQKGVVYPALLFPLTGLERSDLGIPPELLMAIARRESEFNARAASHADARGLMQVMPATAQHIAVDVGLPYDLAELSGNPDYNAMYGATYLAGLRERYGPSIALVAAGYNAGPGRSAQWLKAFGDLRKGADPVDWVEAIPFDETRNYVMRVAEALPIYRARIAGHPVPLTPIADLTGGGVMSVPIPRPVLTLEASARPQTSPRRAAMLASERITEEPGVNETEGGEPDNERTASDTGPEQPANRHDGLQPDTGTPAPGDVQETRTEPEAAEPSTPATAPASENTKKTASDDGSGSSAARRTRPSIPAPVLD